MGWTGWLTPAEASESPYWPQNDLLEVELNSLLTSARVQCEEYAPAVRYAEGVAGAQVTTADADGVVTDAVVPENWRQAQALQARALWRSSIAGGNDQIGAEGLTVTVFPLDWVVRRLLRPQKGVPTLR